MSKKTRLQALSLEGSFVFCSAGTLGIILTALLLCLAVIFKTSASRINDEMFVNTKMICATTRSILENTERKISDLVANNALSQGEHRDIGGIITKINYVGAEYPVFNLSRKLNDHNLLHLDINVAGRRIMAVLNMQTVFKKISGIVKRNSFEIHLIQKGVPFQLRKDVYTHKVDPTSGGDWECTYGQYNIVTVVPRSEVSLAILRDMLIPTLYGIVTCIAMSSFIFFINKTILRPVVNIVDMSRAVEMGVTGIQQCALQPELDLVARHLNDATKCREQMEELSRQLVIKEIEGKSLQQTKSTFISCISHELRTPLNIIRVSAELIKSQKLGPMYNEKYVEYSNNIYKASSMLLSIIDTILEVAKAEAGMLIINRREVSIKRMLNACIESAKRNICGLTVHERVTCPDAKVIVDEEHLLRALKNIFLVIGSYGNNELSVGTIVKDGSMVISLTKDNLDEQSLAELFLKFDSNNELVDSQFTDHDLAISLADKLITANRGKLSVESSRGKILVIITLECTEILETAGKDGVALC